MTDAPPPDDREAFLEWMVDRTFRSEQPASVPVLFYVADYEERTENAPEGLGPSDLKDIHTKSVYLKCTILQSEETNVEGEQVTANIERVLPPNDPSEYEEIAFDSIRVNWKQGRITEL